jgi:hypothetical protein
MKEEGFAAGKSQTCRASEWQSHCSGRIEVRREPVAVNIALPRSLTLH